MKQLSTIFTIIAVLAVSILSSVPCSDSLMSEKHCGEIESHDADGQSGDTQPEQCDQCISCYHHGSQTLPPAFVSKMPAASGSHFMAEGQTFLSQLHYPPSRPPQA